MSLNIVVVGETGAGKSSVINLLADKELAPESSDADTCTEDFTPYPFEVNSTEVCMYDTTGFGPAQRGSLDRLAPYEKACKLIQSLKSKINLVFLCTNKDKLNPTTQHVYHLFHDFFFDGTVPIVLVATYRERESSLDDWWRRNSGDIDNSGLQFAGHACVTALRSQGPGFDLRYQQSRNALIQLLGTATAQGDVILSKPTQPLLDRLAGANETLTKKCGLSTEEAELLTGKVRLILRIPNIVLFGESGAGKSSVINLIAGYRLAKVSSKARGCTLDSTEYRLIANESHLRIFDTVGMNNPTVKQKEYLSDIKKAHELIRGLNRAGGVDLLLFCIHGGRLNDTHLSNYRLFQEYLCEKKVPVAAVVTHLEGQPNMDEWWTENEPDIRELGIDFVGHACVTAIDKDNDLFKNNSPLLEDKLRVSRETLLDLLKTHVQESGTPFVMEADTWLSLFLKRMGILISGGGNLPKDVAIRRMLVEECNMSAERADDVLAKLRPPNRWKFWGKLN
ncbi:P-loop containing nucleoside triphosphate hydrolase protein [Pisolithus tinctorius]|uniref:G domain-containing protein n=1 Tax=Pisolithus tinctorius Marx 270 TaxID=870435 RepID=A0A0C3K4I0_PISTI|nr:P-loop containing nucleoside triphosphate hydrolase protein [Pisolithus tinctorius]KIO04472.1 hypothetical protein M404DRAFT_551291 [Pisolithus tinctorius Marx 270]